MCQVRQCVRHNPHLSWAIPTAWGKMLTDIAITAARLLIEYKARFYRSGCRLHFSVATASRKAVPALRYEWQNANMFGVSFSKHEIAEAEAWLIEAIHLGYCPLCHWHRRGSGTCPNEVRNLLGARRNGRELIVDPIMMAS